MNLTKDTILLSNAKLKGIKKHFKIAKFAGHKNLKSFKKSSSSLPPSSWWFRVAPINSLFSEALTKSFMGVLLWVLKKLAASFWNRWIKDFDFSSSAPHIAFVNEFGVINVSNGTAVITATLGGVEAEGSLTINAVGEFELAPIPTTDPSNVISIFSDTYTNVPVDFYNGYWEPFQTTLSADFAVEGNNILNYTNFNFVGNKFSNPTVDATEKSNLHIDMYIPGELPSLFDFLISVVDFGPDQEDGGGDDTRQQIFVSEADVVAESWISLDFMDFKGRVSGGLWRPVAACANGTMPL